MFAVQVGEMNFGVENGSLFVSLVCVKCYVYMKWKWKEES